MRCKLKPAGAGEANEFIARHGPQSVRRLVRSVL
jgi:hypothetical protein